MRISRSFTVPAGDYDVYLVAKEPTPEKPPKNAPPPKISAIKQTVNVPDFWNNELSTSSVIVAQRIDPLPAPLTPQQQAERPYALGMMEIVPAFETKFTKKSELSTFMLIYNPKVDSANKPDVSVEYNFYQKLAGQPEKFFNKTNPQNLNAQTLPPNFDFAAGHQLQSGQAVPLASFPEGDYRLEIKITDKMANKTLTKEINFTVAARRNTEHAGALMSTSSRMTRRAVVGGLVLLCLPALAAGQDVGQLRPSRASHRLPRVRSKASFRTSRARRSPAPRSPRSAPRRPSRSAIAAAASRCGRCRPVRTFCVRISPASSRRAGRSSMFGPARAPLPRLRSVT